MLFVQYKSSFGLKICHIILDQRVDVGLSSDIWQLNRGTCWFAKISKMDRRAEVQLDILCEYRLHI